MGKPAPLQLRTTSTRLIKAEGGVKLCVLRVGFWIKHVPRLIDGGLFAHKFQGSPNVAGDVGDSQESIAEMCRLRGGEESGVVFVPKDAIDKHRHMWRNLPTPAIEYSNRKHTNVRVEIRRVLLNAKLSEFLVIESCGGVEVGDGVILGFHFNTVNFRSTQRML